MPAIQYGWFKSVESDIYTLRRVDSYGPHAKVLATMTKSNSYAEFLKAQKDAIGNAAGLNLAKFYESRDGQYRTDPYAWRPPR